MSFGVSSVSGVNMIAQNAIYLIFLLKNVILNSSYVLQCVDQPQ